MAYAKDVCPNWSRAFHREGTVIGPGGMCPDCGAYVPSGAKRAILHHRPKGSSAFLHQNMRYDGGMNPDH